MLTTLLWLAFSTTRGRRTCSRSPWLALISSRKHRSCEYGGRVRAAFTFGSGRWRGHRS